MCDLFSLTDLFLVGTALDLVGGYLIAHALLISTQTLGFRSGTYWGGNPDLALGAIEDRIDARAGLLILGTGFTFQAAGYFTTLLDEPVIPASTARAFVALGLALLAAGAALLLWWRLRPRQIEQSVIELARWYEFGARPGDMQMRDTRDELPSTTALWTFAKVWRLPERPLANETADEAVKRMFPELETRP
jgi:hypothetical protein